MRRNAKEKIKVTDRQAAELSSGSTLQPTNNKLNTHHPYDKFVKIAFENKAIAIDFFDAHLKDKKLSKENLQNLGNFATEHQRPFDSALFSDVVYRGVIDNQVYYITVEHQSSPDNTMLLRFLEYTVALIRKEVGQGRGTLEKKMPVIIPICLYSGKKPYRPVTTTDSCFLNNSHAERADLTYSFKLVNLNNLTDKAISQHGRAAILEWFLKDAFMDKKDFCERAKEHLVHERYTELNTDNFREFKIALYEYILSMVESPPTEIIDSLVRIVPLEKQFMLSAAEQLRKEGKLEGRLEGKLEGIQITAKQMVKRGIDREIIKECTNLTDEILDQFSTDVSEAGSPQSLQSTQNSKRLAQSISSSTVEQIGGEIVDKQSTSISSTLVGNILKNPQ